MDEKNFYKLASNEIELNLDQKLTQDIKIFSEKLSLIFQDIAKPIIDIAIFTNALSKTISIKTISFTYAWYISSALFLKWISPPLGEIMAKIQTEEGNLRH
jgi:ATP-binding cassette subfamily D (ALD) long-chain fatty acid import protein